MQTLDYKKYTYAIKKWKMFDKQTCEYYSPWTTKTLIIPISISEAIMILQKNIKPSHSILNRLCKKVERCIEEVKNKEGKVFFRLMSRSPKDVWIHKNTDLGIDPSLDSNTERNKKYTSQLGCLAMSSFSDIINTIRVSERCREDLHSFIDRRMVQNGIVIAEWNDDYGSHKSIQHELRCFVKNKKLIASCPTLKMLFVSDQDQVNFNQISKEDYLHQFCNELSNVVHLDDFVVDLYVESPSRYKVVELNEFDDFTDPIDFTWEYLRNI